MRRTNALCLLLAVAGLSFGVGQTVGQDRADAGATESANPNKAVVKQLKRLYRIQFESQLDIVIGVQSMDRKLTDLGRKLDTTNAILGPDGRTVRNLLREICANTNTVSTLDTCF